MLTMLTRCWVNIIYIVIVTSMSTSSTLSTLRCWQCWHDVELTSSTSFLFLLCQHRRHSGVDYVDSMLGLHRLYRCYHYLYVDIGVLAKIIRKIDIVQHCNVNEVNNVNIRKGSQCQHDDNSIRKASRCERCKQEDWFTMSARCWIDIVKHRIVDFAKR
jgi:hypothetical protein